MAENRRLLHIQCLCEVRAQFCFFHLIRCILIIVSKYLKVRISCSTLLLLSFVNCDMRSPAAVVFLRIFRIRPKDSVFECIIAHWRRDVVYSFSRQTFDRYLRFFGAIVSGPTMHSGSTFILKMWKYFKYSEGPNQIFFPTSWQFFM